MTGNFTAKGEINKIAFWDSSSNSNSNSEYLNIKLFGIVEFELRSTQWGRDCKFNAVLMRWDANK